MSDLTPLQSIKERAFFQLGYIKEYWSNEDIEKLEIDELMIKDLTECFNGDNYEEISEGLFVLRVLLSVNESKKFGEKFICFLVKKIPELLKIKHVYVRDFSLQLFVIFNHYYDDYREVMLEYLASDELGDRKIAVSYYETFCLENEITPLFRFEKDDYASEFAMCSPLYYALRNLALEKIELITGKAFRARILKEPYDGTTVEWYDWKFFWEWWAVNQKKYI